jgi:hypothetical protein
MKYPFFIMAELLKAKILSHQKEIIDNNQLYDSLYYISDMLERWHGDQYEKENDKCNTI